MSKPSLLIMAGGTGGHVFPALAVAEYLKTKGWQIYWLGSLGGMEAEIVPKANIPLYFVSIKGIRRKGLLALLFAPLQILGAIFQSIKILRKLKPTVVLGMGGFVAGPGGIASWLLGYPLVIHEQNAIAGMTNRWLAKVATRVLSGFPDVFAAKLNAIFTGNPVRQELLTLPNPKSRFDERHGPIRLLVLGGSRGAKALNELCPVALAKLPLEKRPEVWHQAGGGNAEITQKIYESYGVTARIDPFIDEMAKAYAWADVVLCRSGALTVAELAAVGVGSILVPFPFAVDDHQTTNGRYLEKGNAAILIPQSGLSPEKLTGILLEYANDRERLFEMANAAYRLAKPDALKQVADYCEEFNHVL